MNCPVCGKEMESGILTTLGPWNYFLPEGVPEIKHLLSVRGIEKRGGFVLHDPFNGGYLTWRACACRACRKIVMEY